MSSATRVGLLGLAGTLLMAFAGSPAHAAPAGIEISNHAPLTLDEVLEATEATHPQLESAKQGVAQAEAERMAARGAWDPVVSFSGRWAPVGYYENARFDAMVRQATPAWGVGLYAGYRGGWGRYPAYKGQLETLSGGEVRAGVDVPLWKDGPIDARRAEIKKTRALLTAADCDRLATQLSLGQGAADAYWSWVAAGLEVRIQQSLLDVAEERDAALEEQAALGSLPEIVVVDNQRLVLDRRAKLIAAERELQAATLDLSLYLRDDGRSPVRVDAAQVPARIPDVRVDLPEVRVDVDEAIRNRPELCRLRMKRRAAEVEVRYRKNQRAPAIDAKAYVARDFGDGPVELAPTEFGVGIDIEMPLALRESRGKYRAAKAKARSLDAKWRALNDRVAADVRRARVDLTAARQRIVVATRQLEVARQLAEAEREKFRLGASDLVIVNLRELAAADAARLLVGARAAQQRAWVDYQTATGRGL